MQSVPCILAAMTPCNRLYAFLGTQLASAHPGSDNPYAEWLRTYASPAFQALPQRMEALLDELGSDNDFGALHSCLPLPLTTCGYVGSIQAEEEPNLGAAEVAFLHFSCCKHVALPGLVEVGSWCRGQYFIAPPTTLAVVQACPLVPPTVPWRHMPCCQSANARHGSSGMQQESFVQTFLWAHQSSHFCWPWCAHDNGSFASQPCRPPQSSKLT